MATQPALHRGQNRVLLTLLAVAVLLLLLALLETRGGGHLECAGVLPPANAQSSSRHHLDAPAKSVALIHEAEAPQDPAATEPGRPEESAPVAKRGNVDGLVVDEHTGEPVPDLDIRLGGEKEGETVRTGSDGGFASTLDFPSGHLSAAISDDGQPVKSAGTDHDAALGTHGWRIEVPIGPTYTVVTVNGLPPAASGWRARLVETSIPPDSDGEIDVAPTELTVVAPMPGRERREWPWVHLRQGPLSWVRFPSVAQPPAPEYFPKLEFRSDEDFLFGRVSVRGTVGLQHGVRVQARAFGIVTGSFDAHAQRVPGVADGEPSDAHVLLVDTGAPGLAKERLSGGEPDWQYRSSSGRFEFDLVEPGEKTIVVLGARCLIAEHRVTVTKGRNDVDEIPLRPLPAIPPKIELESVSDERFAKGWQFVMIRHVEGGTYVPGVVLEPRARPGSAVEIPPLPFGNGGLELHGVNQPAFAVDFEDMEGWDRRVVRLKESKEERLQSTFRVLGPGGQPTGNYALTFGPGGSMIAEYESAPDKPFSFDRRSHVQWTVWTAGNMPVCGSQASFDRKEHKRIAEFQPPRGWGAQLCFREVLEPGAYDSTNRSAGELDAITAALTGVGVPGAGIFMNDVRLATSDGEGNMFVATKMMPVRLTLKSRAFELDHLQRLGSVGLRYIVWLKRKDPALTSR